MKKLGWQRALIAAIGVAALPWALVRSADAFGGTSTDRAGAPIGATAKGHVTLYDDGEKLRGERARALSPSPFGERDLSLVAFPGETLAIQAVVDADEPLTGIRAELHGKAAEPVPFVLTQFRQHFVAVARPSGNGRYPGSLAFNPAAAPPRDAFVGLLADALVPRPLDLEAGARGALWLDLDVPLRTSPGDHEVVLTVTSDSGVLLERHVRVLVGAHRLPYAATKVAVFYDPRTLDRRMGGRSAEISLRQVLHAHHLSALPERRDAADIGLDLDALTGALFTATRGYRGPGEGEGEGVYTIGAYGSLGEPAPEKVQIVESFVEKLSAAGVSSDTEVFVYAVDEDCKSPRAAAWRTLLAASSVGGRVRVGVTCDDPPAKQAATLVMLPASSYREGDAREGRAHGKAVWAYNGIRPHAGPMMLDVPAVDLRANGWIAMRYDVTRWFYWESTYWLDGNRGGKGGESGFDPFAVAESFHNADGDYAMGDGILLYPGTQTPPGMTTFGEAAVYPSVRLKNLRRGVLDAGYVQLARERDRARADAIVARMIPVALGHAREKDRAAWPTDPRVWLRAREELFHIAEGPVVAAGKPPTSCRLVAVGFAITLLASLVTIMVERVRRHAAISAPR